MTCKDGSLIHHVYTTWNIPFLAFSVFLEMWMWKRTCSTISTTSWLHGRPHASLLHISWISEWAASFTNFAKAHASPSIGSQVRPTWSHSPVKCRTCPGADLTVRERERVERAQNTISRLHTTHFLITLAFYSYVCSPDGATPHLHPTPGHAPSTPQYSCSTFTNILQWQRANGDSSQKVWKHRGSDIGVLLL